MRVLSLPACYRPARGDRLKEGLEWFHLKLINVQGAEVADDRGLGTIYEDDGLPDSSQPCPPSIPDCASKLRLRCSHRLTAALVTTFCGEY